MWPFSGFVIALPNEVGGTFGVPPGCESRSKIEAKLGPPDLLYHLSSYYTIVDYTQRGLRFYYDTQNRTMTYSTFSPRGPLETPPAGPIDVCQVEKNHAS